MKPQAEVETWHVDARDNVAALEDVRAAALELIGDDEIIQLSLRPSLWLIAFTGARFVLGAAAIAAIAGLLSDGFRAPAATNIFLIAVGAAGVRVAVAALQWASRLYILTNRRVLRFRGVLSVDVCECLLARITSIKLRQSAAQQMLSIGSIAMTPLNDARPPVIWRHVSRPAEVHELLERAIRKSQSGR